MINSILEIIKDNFYHRESSNDLQIRCPYCGDSRSNPRTCSLYISKKPVGKYNTYVYHCFRASCKAKGTLYDLLLDLGLLSQLNKEQISFLLTNYNKHKLHGKLNYNDTDNKIIGKNFILKTYSSDSKNDEKINYIKKRLGIDYIPKFLKKYIVTHVEVKKYSSDFKIKPYILKMINKTFVGFKTYNGSKIIFRNVNADMNSHMKIRYYNLRLKPEVDYFIITPNSNVFNPLKKGKIFLAEGIFSLLHGYFGILRKNIINHNDNLLLGATLGGSVKTFNLLYNYIVYTFGVPDWDVFILSDTDININMYKSFSKNVIGNLNILYNHGKNDFGEEIGSLIVEQF